MIQWFIYAYHFCGHWFKWTCGYVKYCNSNCGNSIVVRVMQQLCTGLLVVSVVACAAAEQNISQKFEAIEETEVISSDNNGEILDQIDATTATDLAMTPLSEKNHKLPQMVSYMPANPEEDALSRDVFGSIREFVKDDWHPDALLYEYSFDRLTPTGKTIFEAARDYVDQQKDAQFQEYAQPLQCATNVSYVLGQAGYQIEGEAVYSIPYMIEAIEYSGGQIYELPRYNSIMDNTGEIIDYLNHNFGGSIPTGAIIVGCKTKNCMGSELSGGHIGILGDKNEFGDLMIYHNNWYRPNHHKGLRMPYMVSLENMYVLLRPREWMATPWLSFAKNSSEQITEINNASAVIDDFYIFGGDYYIKIALLPALVEEMGANLSLPVHKNISSGNIHRNIHPKEADWMVCRSKEPLKTIDARLAPYGELNTQVLYELDGYDQKESMLHDRFEFAILEEQDEWVSALVYDQDRFWGSNDIFGPLWLHRSKVQCWQKHDIFMHRQHHPMNSF